MTRDESESEDQTPAFMTNEQKATDAPGETPDQIVDRALSLTARYGECSVCGEGQYYIVIPGHSETHECSGCGAEMFV